MEAELRNRADAFVARYGLLERRGIEAHARLSAYGVELDKVVEEQRKLGEAREVLAKVKVLLTQSSLLYCERLATVAVQTIFGVPYTVRYSVEDEVFLLDKGDYTVDISSDEGGGMATVVSFVFSLYLIIKQGCRRLMLFDEAFTQISDEYLPRFIEFVRKICNELGFDILLVTHDVRLEGDMVDSVYVIEEGEAHKVK